MQNFNQTMGILKDIYDTNPNNLPNRFWTTIDIIPNETLFSWVEKMLSIRGLLLGQDYLRVVGIQHDFRQYKKYTTKQKRRIAIHLIEKWYDVELASELY